MSDRARRLARLRRRVHLLLDDGAATRGPARWIHGALILLIVLSIGCVVLESVPTLNAAHGRLFDIVEFVALFGFTFEYALRLWTAPEMRPYDGMTPWSARLAYARSWPALIDLLAVIPSYLQVFSFTPADLKMLLLLRLARFLKLARYSPGMRSLLSALEAERKALGASAVVLFGLVLAAAAAMHFVEHEAQPDKFGSIPEAMWWAVVTLTTVGYGDVVPVTLAGRVIAGFTMLCGLMMIALPVGIMATAFSEEIHKREFVVTWSMIARVPLFASLDAGEIADIMQYLRAQTVPAGTLIVRRGEVAESMYFITAGSVEIETRHERVRLAEGHFFGEIAVLKKTRRNANVRACEATKLLVLDAADVHFLMERKPEFARRIEEIARERADVAEARTDILSDEIKDAT